MAEETNPAITAATAAPFDVEVIRHDVPTSIEEAATMSGVAVNELQKSMVIRVDDGEYVLVLVPGERVIDWKKLRAALDRSRLSLAPQDEAEAATGFARGTITPFGMSRDLPVVVDSAIRGTKIALGGGAPGVNLVLAADDLIDHTGALVADITKPAG